MFPLGPGKNAKNRQGMVQPDGSICIFEIRYVEAGVSLEGFAGGFSRWLPVSPFLYPFVHFLQSRLKIAAFLG
ncbi:MAG: hypothetical protein K0S39_209 [Paenibacillus sp.]|nr:hypothetical protein [Paenibacillus sp.]